MKVTDMVYNFQLLECPSVYELMGCLDFSWQHDPLLEIWKENEDGDGDSTILLESYSMLEAIPIFIQALSNNKVSCVKCI